MVPSVKTLRVGRRTTVTVTVKRRGATLKGKRVTLTGGGVKKLTRTTDRKGKARFVVRPKTRSAVKVRPLAQKKGCATRTLKVSKKL